MINIWLPVCWLIYLMHHNSSFYVICRVQMFLAGCIRKEKRLWDVFLRIVCLSQQTDSALQDAFVLPWLLLCSRLGQCLQHIALSSTHSICLVTPHLISDNTMNTVSLLFTIGHFFHIAVEVTKLLEVLLCVNMCTHSIHIWFKSIFYVQYCRYEWSIKNGHNLWY
jgi:hypothetical protein